MSYKDRKYPGIVFFDEVEGKTAKSKSSKAYKARQDFGREDELALMSYLKDFFKKNKEKYPHIKVWDGKVLQTEIIGIRANNILDTIFGDVVVRREFRNDREIIARFDAKRSKTEDTNATASYHGTQTELFNSDWNTFYATKKNGEWFAVWGQDLVMLIPEGNNRVSGNQWWTKPQLGKYLIPLDKLLHVLLKDIDRLKKCDEIGALRDKYNYVKPKSAAQIAKEHRESLVAVPAKKPAIKPKDVLVPCKSKTPGFYGTVSIEQCKSAELSIDNIIFVLSYCKKPGEADREPVKVYFSDIKDNWKTLLSNNAYIRSGDLKKYFRKT